MAKKRKTRKEKELSQQRRAKPNRKDDHSSSSLPEKKRTSTKDDSKSNENVVEQNEDQRLRMKSMKYSLVVFGGLVVFQVAVWLSAQLDILPSGWADILVG